jgi:hypothetical protein
MWSVNRQTPCAGRAALRRGAVIVEVAIGRVPVRIPSVFVGPTIVPDLRYYTPLVTSFNI